MLIILGGLVALPGSGGVGPDESPAFAPHAPILIEGESNWTAANGVTGGNGTSTNPYLIEGWDVDASSATGITITGTVSWFLIQRVYVHSGFHGIEAPLHDGIELDEVQHGQVRQSLVQGNTRGILISLSPDIRVEGNNVSQNAFCGMCADQSYGLRIERNRIVQDSTGLGLGGSPNAVVADNWIAYNSANGVSVSGDQHHPSYGVTISRNDIANSSIGLRLQDVTSVQVLQNRIRGSDSYGVEAWTSGASFGLVQNDFIDNLYDVHVDIGGNVTWGGPYPTGGNFWSSYRGDDQCSGTDQDICPASDGIGDTPYVVPTWDSFFHGVDRYPYIRPQFPSDAPANTPPVGAFSLKPFPAVAGSNVTADASASWDLQDPNQELQVRWDWEADGMWDTAWSSIKVTNHRYAGDGTYSIRMQVRDSAGLNDTTTKELTVTIPPSPGWPVMPWVLLGAGIVCGTVSVALVIRVWRRRRRTETPPP